MPSDSHHLLSYAAGMATNRKVQAKKNMALKILVKVKKRSL
jgi:hypothetical protein